MPTALLAGVLSLLLTGLILRLARRHRLGQHVREDGPESHRVKEGTPSLGGLGILGAIVVSVVLMGALSGWSGAEWRRPLLILALAVAYALIGLADDLAKLRGRNTKGVKARYRIVLEVLVAVAFAATIGLPDPDLLGGSAAWGFSALASPQSGILLGIVGLLLAAFVIAGAGNAVNFADGLDGLAATLVAICAAGLYLAGAGGPEWGLPALAAAGACAGFLWYNAHPARIFMGDVGSLGLGGLLGAVAVAAGIELLFGLMALVFVAEVLSVVLQVIWFRRTGRRLFRMTPIHHAFELRGWSEPQIVARFGLVAALCTALALMWFSAT